MYFDWEGRIISRILINFLTYHKLLWNLMNAFIITSIIYMIEKIIHPKHKKTIFLLIVLIILGMNIFTFSQVVVWVAGNITYLFVIPLLLYYFNCILKNKIQTKKQIIIFSFLNMIMPMFVEHMGVVLVVGNLLLIIAYYKKTKTLNKTLIIYFLCSLLGFFSMLLSPGSRKRNILENQEFNHLSLLGKVKYNLPNFIYYHYIINYYWIILMTIGNYYLVKNLKNKIIKWIGYFYLLPFPIITMAIYLIRTGCKINLLNQINQNTPFIIFYFISITIIEILLIYKNNKEEEEFSSLFFYVLGIVANTSMLLSPTWGYRTSVASYILVSISYLFIIDKNIQGRKLISNILLGIVGIMLSFYSILYISVAIQNKENIKMIKQQKREKKKIIEVIIVILTQKTNIT